MTDVIQPCARTACGQPPSAHIGWALGHLHRDPTEVQPPAADATVDMTKPYAYRCDRLDQDPPRLLSYGTQMAVWELLKTPHDVVKFQAAQTRIGHGYFGPLLVRVWQHRGNLEHYREDPPADAYTVRLPPEDRNQVLAEVDRNGWDKL